MFTQLKILSISYIPGCVLAFNVTAVKTDAFSALVEVSLYSDGGDGAAETWTIWAADRSQGT